MIPVKIINVTGVEKILDNKTNLGQLEERDRDSSKMLIAAVQRDSEVSHKLQGLQLWDRWELYELMA